MSVKIKKIKIGSLKITTDFLQKLGLIIERDVETRKKSANQKIKEELRKKRNTTLSEKTFVDFIKMEHRVRYHLTYTITSPDEELKISSMKELLSLSALPNKIESISCRLRQYSDKYVDMSFILDNNLSSSIKLTLSSENESKILKIEKELKDLFSANRTGHYWLLNVPFSKYFLLHGFAGFFAFFGILAIFKVTTYFFPQLSNMEIITALTPGYFIVLFLFFNFQLKYLYPYYSFELMGTNSTRNNIKKVIGLLILGILISFIHDVITFFT